MSNFIFSNLCGSVYSRGPCSAPSASLAAALALTSLPAIAGNVVFTPDGNSLISPVGNRVTVFNLASSTSVTLPFEHVKGARSLCCRLAAALAPALAVTRAPPALPQISAWSASRPTA